MIAYHGTDGVAAALAQTYGLKRGSFVTTQRHAAVSIASKRATEAGTSGVLLAVGVAAEDVRWVDGSIGRTTRTLPVGVLTRSIPQDQRFDRPPEPLDSRTYSMRLRD